MRVGPQTVAEIAFDLTRMQLERRSQGKGGDVLWARATLSQDGFAVLTEIVFRDDTLRFECQLPAAVDQNAFDETLWLGQLLGQPHETVH